MRKWAFFCVVAAAVAVIGCGGSKSSSSNSSSSTSTTSSSTTATGTTGTTTRAPAATVNLGTTVGLVYTAFLTGASRSAGDLYLNVENILLNDKSSQTFIQRQQTTPLVMHLAAYTFSMATIDVPLSGQNSELFDSVTIVPYSFAQETTSGFVGLNSTDPGYLAPLQLDQNPVVSASGTTPGLYGATQINPNTRLRVFPGRDSSIPFFVDQTMFGIDSTGDAVGLTPDPNQPFNTAGSGVTKFADVNEPLSSDLTVSGKVAGFLSDMVQIDLSHIPAASVPKLKVSGKAATHFYVSGDKYAMSDDAAGATGNFEELTLDPTQPIDGRMGQPNTVLSSQFQFGSMPGLYDLTASDPTDLTGLSRITSLFGRWRAITDLMSLSGTSFDIIVFPNSNEAFTFNSPADVVAIAHTGNTITNMYIGNAYYSGGTGGIAAKAQLYPLTQFVNGTIAGEVDYTLNTSSFTGVGGVSTTNDPAVRNGTYTLSSGSAPTGFLSTGTFVVFR